MNAAGYMLFIVCCLASLADRNTRIYFGSFGLMMLGHYFATWRVTVEYFNYAYLSSAVLCFFLFLTAFKSRDNMFLKLVCGACVFVNFLGWSLWKNSLSVQLYDDLYLGIYAAVALYLIPRAYNDGINRILVFLRRILSFAIHNMSKYLGVNQ